MDKTNLNQESTMLTTKSEIKDWLVSMNIQNYKIHDNLVVDVNYSVDISKRSLTHIPVQFGVVKGSFRCAHNKLSSLKGSPHSIRDDFDCSFNKLTSLEHSPEEIGGDFDCSDNQLTTLKGMLIKQSILKGNFECSFNKLTCLKFAPFEIQGSLNCEHNEISTLIDMPQIIKLSFKCAYNYLTSLEGISLEFSDSLDCSFNQLQSLKHCPLNLIDLYCEQNNLTSLDGIGFIKERLVFSYNKVSHLPSQLATMPLIELDAKNNKLTSLVNSPLEIKNYNVSFNPLISLKYCPFKISNEANFEEISCDLEALKNHEFHTIKLSARESDIFKQIPIFKARNVLLFNCPTITDEAIEWTINFFKLSKHKDSYTFLCQTDSQTLDREYDLSTIIFKQDKKGYAKNEVIKSYLERKTLLKKVDDQPMTTNKKLKI